MSAVPERASDCFVPRPKAAGQALDSQRAVRYAALLQLIDEIQRVRTIAEVAHAAATRWKHCANVLQWQLLCVHRGHAALVVSQARGAEALEATLAELGPWDAAQWRRLLPGMVSGERLEALRGDLPAHLAAAQGAELAIVPVQQGGVAIAVLTAMSGDQRFDLLDRKFLGHVASAMAGRINAILSERLLAAELVTAERHLAEERQAAILGRLVNGVAHELNTPLGVQLSACDSLGAALQAPVPALDEVREVVGLIGEQARRAARIVRRLKQVSAASRSGTPVPTRLMDLVEEIAVSCAAQADAPEITLVGDEDIVVDIDRDALQMVLGELIDNAALHGRRGQRPCALTLELSRADGTVILDVRDDGPGLEEGVHARFFQPFVTTKPSQGHMGLGGYIASSLMRDALGGSASLVEPAPPAGGVWIRLAFSRPSSAP